MDSVKMSPELENLKSRLRATWIAGDFGQIALGIQEGAEEFVERLNIRPGMRILDVACGTGNLALPAARKGAAVTGIDIAPNLIDSARERANAEGLKIRFEVGDAEAMPYGDESFDMVITMFGAMFTPRPDLTAEELTRVCARGGTLAMANWTPDGFTGEMFKIGAKHVPPPKMPSPLMWGVEEAMHRRFGSMVTGLRTMHRRIDMKFPFGPEEVVEHFRKYFGPTQKQFDALDEAGQSALRKDLVDLWAGNNSATDGTTCAVSEYLEVRATRA